MTFPMPDLNDWFGNVPKSIAQAEDFGAPVVAAAMIPVSLAMAGWVAALGFGLGILALGRGGADEATGDMPKKEPTRAKPMLRVVETEPGEPKKAASVVNITTARPTAKATKAAKPVAKAKRAQVKAAPLNVVPQVTAAPKPLEVVAVSEAPALEVAPAAIAPAPIKAKAVPPSKPKPKPKPKPESAELRIESKSSAKGISLARVSIQEDKPASPTVAADADKPKGLATARPSGPDNLKLISGIGPKIEGILHGLGVFHFDQVAAWTPREVAWVDQYLKFNGRIVRDKWINQAKALATGGPEEYVRQFGKDPR